MHAASTGVRLAQILAGIGSTLVGWVLLGFLLIGPAYSTYQCSASTSGVTVCSTETQGLVEVNGPSVLVSIGGVALALAVVGAGTVLHAKGWRPGRWVAAVPTVALTGLSLISFTLGPLLWPSVALAWLAFVLGFAADERPASAR